MGRLLIPIIPAMIIGAVANGTGFALSDAIVIGLLAWSVFVVFRSLTGVTSTIIAVCLLGALSQMTPRDPLLAYTSTTAEASPGTVTHLVRAVYQAIGGASTVSPASASPASASIAPAPTGPALTSPPPTGTAPAAGVPSTQPVRAGLTKVPGAAPSTFTPGSRQKTPTLIASIAPLPVGTMVRSPAIPAQPMTFAGQPRVIDGATLSIDGHLVRLAGISPPEGASGCWRNGQAVSCSTMATERLSQLVGANWVNCHGPTQGNAIAALCSSTMVDDLAKTMLDEGWALLNRDSGATYRAVAAAARGARRGLWQSNFARADELEPTVTTARR